MNRLPFVTTRMTTEVMAAVDFMCQFDPVQEATLLPILGPSRCGKSEICKQIAATYPDQVVGRQTIRPVIYIELITGTTLPSMIAQILEVLGDPDPFYGNHTARFLRLAKALREQKVMFLVIDEIHHLIDADTLKIAYKAAECLKNILNLKTCHVIIAGQTHAERILDTNTQIELRAIKRILPRHHDWRTEADRKEWRAFLHVIEQGLGLPVPSRLGATDTAFRIHYFASGRLGRAVRLIEIAEKFRLKTKPLRAALDNEILAQAADLLGLGRSGGKAINPFLSLPPEAAEPAPIYELVKNPNARAAE